MAIQRIEYTSNKTIFANFWVHLFLWGMGCFALGWDFFNNFDELMDLSDIRGWRHTWIDHTEANTNVWGDRITGKTMQKKNMLVLKTSNPHQPLYKIYLRHHAQGEFWMARFNALING